MRCKNQSKKSKSNGPVNPFDKLLIDPKHDAPLQESEYKQQIIDGYLNGVSYFDEVKFDSTNS